MRHTFLPLVAATALLIAGSAWAPDAAAQATGSSRIEMAQAGQSAGAAKVRVKSAVLRSAPDVKSRKLNSLRRGTKLQVLGSSGDWSHVKVGKWDGYVMSSLLTM
jgi:hypothetical protein